MEVIRKRTPVNRAELLVKRPTSKRSQYHRPQEFSHAEVQAQVLTWVQKVRTRRDLPQRANVSSKASPFPTVNITFAIAYSAQTETNRVFGVFLAQSQTSSASTNSNSNHSSDPYSGAGADDFDPITGTYGRKIRLGGDDEDRVCILQ